VTTALVLIDLPYGLAETKGINDPGHWDHRPFPVSAIRGLFNSIKCFNKSTSFVMVIFCEHLQAAAYILDCGVVATRNR